MFGPQADEELARRAVRIGPARRADCAAHEGARAEFGGYFGLIRILPAPQRAVSASASLRRAALNNAIGQNAVKSEAVVEFLVDQLLEILDVSRRDVGVER